MEARFVIHIVFITLSCFFHCIPLSSTQAANDFQIHELATGVMSLRYGEQDAFAPFQTLSPQICKEAIERLGDSPLPFPLDKIDIIVNERGCQVSVPLDETEELYGFGLQIETMRHRGLKKTPIVNDYPSGALGYSHAPQTFYISSNGYGIIVNTSRQTTFLCGTHHQVNKAKKEEDSRHHIALSTEELYQNQSNSEAVYIDIPGAKGVELIVLAGPNVGKVIQRYNLLSGGGCLPPLWGLGFKYRMKSDAVQDSVIKRTHYFRQQRIPCDVIGLEPGWQTHTYSCSYVWSHRFPQHQQMIDLLRTNGFRVNLWEHAYVHPSSPIYESMNPYSGNFEVWNGLVPDFLMTEARDIYARYHEKFLDDGISGFKMDECDNSNRADATKNWGFPDCSIFPSGIDGAQMHQLFGSLYVRTIDSLFHTRNQRTWQEYRSSGLFMSAIPAVIYSDTYDSRDYIRMICNAAFSGLLWCPEVREALNPQDFFHRLQTVILSPQALVNAWYLDNPPWLQFDMQKNNQGRLLTEAPLYESYTRKLLEERMRLIPYLYAAFWQYRTEGIPPFRPLLMDYPEDKETSLIDDQYLIGEHLMAAPLYGVSNTRNVYFPAGKWYNYHTGKCYEGGKHHEITTSLDQLPLYVKEGTILPLAHPVQYVDAHTIFKLDCKMFGDTENSCITLWEDDGETYDFERGVFNRVEIRNKGGKIKMTRIGDYKIKRYQLSNKQYMP